MVAEGVCLTNASGVRIMVLISAQGELREDVGREEKCES